MRNKKAFAGVIFNSIFVSLLLLSLYYEIGQWSSLNFNKYITDQDLEGANDAYQKYLQNMTGLAFMLSNFLSISASVNVIIQIPL